LEKFIISLTEALKNEIFLNKDKIIRLLSKKTKNSGVKDIRF